MRKQTYGDGYPPIYYRFRLWFKRVLAPFRGHAYIYYRYDRFVARPMTEQELHRVHMIMNRVSRVMDEVDELLEEAQEATKAQEVKEAK